MTDLVQRGENGRQRVKKAWERERKETEDLKHIATHIYADWGINL